MAGKKTKNSSANASAVKQVTAALASMNLHKRRRPRRRRAQGSNDVPIPGGYGTAQITNPMSEIRLSRREYLGGITVAASAGEAKDVLQISPDTFTWLKNVSLGFERIKWHKCRVIWKPAVGTSKNGLITFGPDWLSDMDAAGATRVNVQALTPNADTPVWCPVTLTLPPNKLMTRQWYGIRGTAGSVLDKIDKQPCLIGYNCTVDSSSDSQFIGEFWVDYTVTLSGTA